MNPSYLSPTILLLILLCSFSLARFSTAAADPPPQCNRDLPSPADKARVADICGHAADPEGCEVVVRYLSGGGVKSSEVVSVVSYHLDACYNAVAFAKKEAVDRKDTPTASACDEAIRSVEQARKALQTVPTDTDGVLDGMSSIPSLAMTCEQTDTTLTSGYIDNALSLFKKYWHIPSSASTSSPAAGSASSAKPGQEFSAARAICNKTNDTLTCISFVRNAGVYDKKSVAGLTNAAAVMTVAVRTTIAETKSAAKKIKEVVAEQKINEKAKHALKELGEELMESVMELDDARDAMDRGDGRTAAGHLEAARAGVRAARKGFNLNLFALDSSEREEEAQQRLWEHLDYLVAAADVVLDLARMI